MNAHVERFKEESGKWIDSRTYLIEHTETMDSIWEELRGYRRKSGDTSIWYVTVPEHPYDHPKLLL